MIKLYIFLLTFIFNFLTNNDLKSITIKMKDQESGNNQIISKEKYPEIIKQPSSIKESFTGIYDEFKPVYFKPWSIDILNENDLKNNINKIKNIIYHHPSLKVLINGYSPLYTDFTNTVDNYILSMERANIVKSEFEKAGIPSHFIYSLGLGSKFSKIKPQKDNPNAQDKDRKVEITLAIGAQD